MDINLELKKATFRNLAVKSKIMAIIFSFILLFQFIVVSLAYSKTTLFSTGFMRFTPIIGIFLIFSAFLIELKTHHHLNRVIAQGKDINYRIVYLVTLTEICFPTVILFYAGFVILKANIPFQQQLISSPPTLMYYIMIILSSLMIDRKLCIISGIVGAIGYLTAAMYVMHNMPMAEIDTPNILFRSLFLVLAGIISGYVSVKIKESLTDSISAKDALIHQLDSLVNEKTIEITRQKEEIEARNKDITDSINYANRIQKAVIATEDYLDKYCEDYFILYLPKDIVSGDFYWMAPISETNLALCVADCTGHGVPGALMSMLNISLLNQAVNEKEIHEPNKVFDHVREALIKTLSSGQGSTAKDGMDAVLINIEIFHSKEGQPLVENSKIMKYSYAAAQNSPFIIRKNEIIECDTDKMPVGKGEKNEPFTLYKKELMKNDCLYLYTDGFADQFGGPKGKKFKYSNLNKLLLDIHHLPMHEQKEKLHKTFDEWKGNLEQIDDVCILGIRI